MLRLLQMTLFTVTTISVHSQIFKPSGAESAALMHATTALVNSDVHFSNPGATPFLGSISASISYENAFFIQGFQSQSACVILPFKKSGLSFGGQLNGETLYRESKVGLGYALKLHENLSMGVQLNHIQLRLENHYGSRSGLSAEFGTYLNLNEQLSVGAAIFNLSRTRLSDFQDDRFSTVFRSGFSYNISNKVKVMGEIWKEVESPISPRFGLEYLLHPSFEFRCGFSANPGAYSFGAGYVFKAFKLHLSSSYHQRLGWSPQCSLYFSGP
jgi:hypothetical protein